MQTSRVYRHAAVLILTLLLEQTVFAQSFQLLWSTSPDRSSPASLEGASLTDEIYVFVEPATGVSGVEFFIDDPALTGGPYSTESRAPWDLAGTTSSGLARPFNTLTLSDGAHVISAAIAKSNGGGTQIIHAGFTLAHGQVAPVFDPPALGFVLAPGETDTATVNLDTTNGEPTGFDLGQTPSWLQIAADQGTTPAALTVAVDAGSLTSGLHAAFVQATTDAGVSATLRVEITIQSMADQVHLAWVDSPSTTLTIVWRTQSSGSASTVEYRPAGSTTWNAAGGSVRASGTQGTLHEVTLTGLTPATEYEYRVSGDGGQWSDVLSTRTAPATSGFDLVFMADMGIVGRADGLTTGTQQVIDEVAQIDPRLVLLGGDYAYYNTETRYATLDEAIDAWFAQMEPIASRTPMMPTYGNHETDGGEGYGPWAARFPTPAGHDGRRYYSFDIADVHFISILATSDSAGLDASALHWIEQDIIDSKAAGQKWIIPFMHVPAYGDGAIHPSNATLRSQLAPIFETHGVQLVLAASDQSYERSWPLANMPDVNTPTIDKNCVTATDGVTWMKVSPGGKLSNANNGFSFFLHSTPPAWTAVRDNTMHHFAHLQFQPLGVLNVSVYGVVGDGSAPVLIDAFEIRLACDAAPVFSVASLVFDLQQVQTDSRAVELAAADGSTRNFSIQKMVDWVSAVPSSGTTPATINVAVDTALASLGTQMTTLTATSDGSATDTLDVTLNVEEEGQATGPVAFSQSSVTMSAEQNQQDTATIELTATSPTNFTVSESSPWLSVSPSSGQTPGTITLTATASSLPPATYFTRVRAHVNGTESDVLEVLFTVSPTSTGGTDDPVFSTDTFDMTVGQGQSTSATVPLQSTGGQTSFTISEASPWLSVKPTSGQAPTQLTLEADASILSPAIYLARVHVQKDGITTDTLSVLLTVTSGPSGDGIPSFDQASVTMSASSGQSTTQNVGISSSNANPAPFTISEFAPWLAVSPSSGSAPTSVVLTASAGALSPATYFTRVRLMSGDTEVGSLDVLFTISAGTGSAQFSQDSVSLSAGGGQSDSASVSISATNGGAIGYTLKEFSSWLSISPTSGTTPSSFTLTGSSSGLAPATYFTRVNVLTAGSVSDTLDVLFTVTGGSSTTSLSFNPSSLSLSATAGGTDSGQAQLSASDGANVSFNASDNATWLSIDSSGNQTPATLTLNANSSGLSSGTHTATVTATAGGYDSATLNVTFTVQSDGESDCFPLDCSELLVDAPYALSFDEDHGKILDKDGTGTGFTYIDMPSKGSGYIPQNLDLDTNAGVLKITTTAGLMSSISNSQDNALGVGIDAASQATILTARLRDPPAGTNNYEQGGLWFGVDEDNYVKLTHGSHPTGIRVQFELEVNGQAVQSKNATPTPIDHHLSLKLFADPGSRTIRASYQVDHGVLIEVDTFDVPGEFFSFDAAGIDPEIGTRSFGGVFASHRHGAAPLVYSFDDFSVDQVTAPPSGSGFSFTRSSFDMPFPTSLVWGPDDRLYALELFGTIHAFTLEPDKQVVDDEIINSLTNSLGDRLSLGLTVDPSSTPNNVILWVSHSSPSLGNGVIDSGQISRLSGPGFSTVEHVITGLPRAKANHATNSLHFGPDGRLYIAQGGITGAGAPNSAPTEFGDRAEQPLSAALLVADVYASGFDGTCHNETDIFGPPPCDVEVYASGLRNAYDFVFHSNGKLYAPDNGLGVTGTYPASPTPPCSGMANPSQHNPGPQPDWLELIVEGGYYGHPNPSRDECVFEDGSFQGVAPLSNYKPPIYNLGDNRSADGTIEYQSDVFCSALKGELLITNYSFGDDITRIRLSPDGQTVLSASQLAVGFNDPLPLAQDPDGTIYVGEFGGNLITTLVPNEFGCWRTVEPMPAAVLDGSAAGIGGKMYVAGGKTSAGHINTLYIYDTASDSWTTGPSMPGAAVEDPAVVAHDGMLYVLGGGTSPFTGAVTQALKYNPQTQQWSTLASMNVARSGATAQVIGGLIYVAGGLDTSGASLASVSVYNPGGNSWSSAPSMNVRRDNPVSAAFGGKMYVFGGRTRNADGSSPDPGLTSVEMFDPSSNSWSFQEPMPTGRRRMIIGTINGRAQISGGEKTSEDFPEHEEYNPATNTWRVLTSLPTPRHGAAFATINGVLYAAGGGPVTGLSFTDVNESFSLASP